MILTKGKRPSKCKTPIEYKSKNPPINDDPWVNWKPQWTEKKRAEKKPPSLQATPHDFQERHAPTRKTDKTRTNETRRRIVDARLWDAMTFSQQDAACAIANAFDMLGKGLGYATSNWERIPGCRGAENVTEAHARMISAYTLWARECTKRKVSHAMVIDVLCYGFSCKMIDCDRRQRNGATRENLMKGLTLYCHLQGWR